jgi:WD40 repeat protein
VTAKQFPETIRVWDIASGQEQARLTLDLSASIGTNEEQTQRIDFSPDGKLLVAGGLSGTIKIWELKPRLRAGRDALSEQPKVQQPVVPTQVLSWPAHAGQVNAVRISPDGRWLATSGYDGRLILWDFRTGHMVARAHANAWSSFLEWSPSGDSLLGGSQLWTFLRPFSRTVFFKSDITENRMDQLRFSPDERWLAVSLSRDKTPWLVDLVHPQEVAAPLQGGAGYLSAELAFSPAGDKLWSHNSHQHMIWTTPWPVPAHQSESRFLPAFLNTAFGPGQERIAAGPEDQTRVDVYDLDSGRSLWSWVGKGNGYYPAVSPDSRLLVLGISVDGHSRIVAWDAATGLINQEIKGDKWDRWLVFHGKDLLSVTRSGTITQVTLDGQKPPRAVRVDLGPDAYVHAWTCSENGSVLAGRAWRGQILIVSLIKKTLQATVRRAGSPAGNEDPIALSPDGARLAAFDGQLLKVWETGTGKELAQVRLPQSPFRGLPTLGFARDGESRDRLLIFARDGQISSWRPGDREPRPLGVLGRRGTFQRDHLQVTADGKRVVGYNSRGITVWELPAGSEKVRGPAQEPRQFARAMVVSPNGRWAALVHHFAVCKIWNVDNNEVLLNLGPCGSGPLRDSLCFSPDGTHVAAAKVGASLGVFSLTQRKQVFDVAARWSDLVALSEGGRRLAVASGNLVMVYASPSQKPVATISIGAARTQGTMAFGAGRVRALAFDDRGTLLATVGGSEGAVSIWDTTSGKLVATFPTGRPTLSRVALSKTGRWLAAGDDRGVARVWDLAEVRQHLKRAGLDWNAPPLPAPSRPVLTGAPALPTPSLDLGRKPFGRVITQQPGGPFVQPKVLQAPSARPSRFAGSLPTSGKPQWPPRS